MLKTNQFISCCCAQSLNTYLSNISKQNTKYWYQKMYLIKSEPHYGLDIFGSVDQLRFRDQTGDPN